jgi:hypothetical protein
MNHHPEQTFFTSSSLDRLMPPNTCPYYVYAPPYTRQSAGVRALHLLVHSLNEQGLEAYLVPQFQLSSRSFAHPKLNTPILSAQIAGFHFHEGRTPIVVYPEINHGNPLQGPFVARYILNFPGLLGGPKEFSPQDFLFYYSEDLVDLSQPNAQVLFIPTADPRKFAPPSTTAIRYKKVLYAGKYQRHHGQSISHLPGLSSEEQEQFQELRRGCIEITNGLPDSMTQLQIIQLFQEASVFYCLENSALITEAILCGCPVVLLQHDYFDKVIARTELSTKGIAFDLKSESLEAARAQLVDFRKHYLKNFDLYWQQLTSFIEATQSRARQIEYLKPIAYQQKYFGLDHPRSTKIIALYTGFYYLRDRGPIKFLQLCARFALALLAGLLPWERAKQFGHLQWKIFKQAMREQYLKMR